MGKLIVIEGLDASGKETQTGRLFERLQEAGVQTKKVCFPDYESDSSALIKMYLAGKFGSNPAAVNAFAASSFYAVDRYASYKTQWESFYQGGGLVLADRYTTSNMIHQGCKIADLQERSAYLEWLKDYEYGRLGLPQPDLVLFLDMPPAVGMKLMAGRHNKAGGETKDIHERSSSYLEETYHTALDVAQQQSWQRIPCSDGENPLPVEEIAQQIWQIVCQMIK
ncbi:MAG: thymidylate kinase [Clostridia bacterium]|nr:thymidylate kinase [Clostridia bacterium]